MSFYLLILILAFCIPFLFSFHPKVQFSKYFKVVCGSITISAIPFILWDIVFTKIGVWGFNDEHLLGFRIFSLPIEELLFFWLIPFCCIFSYYLIEKYNIVIYKSPDYKYINTIIAILLLCTALLNYNHIYTFCCLSICSIVLFIETHYIKIVNYNYYYVAFIFLFIPFMLVNGSLTGSFFDKVVVWYNNSCILGIYLITIPIEDLVYSFLMIHVNLISYKLFL